MTKSGGTKTKAKSTPSALPHRRTRADHAMETAEDYVEAVARLAGYGLVRVGGLALCLGVSHVTVVRTLERLRRDGLVSKDTNSGIALTPKGRRLAGASRARHDVVVRFLQALGVPPGVAQQDAEGIEHHVSKATLRAMKRFGSHGV